MTLLLAAAFMALLTAALLFEEWHFRRTHPTPPAPRTLRCLVCPGAPGVADMATHSRLAHGSRVRAVEDRAEWGTP